MVCVCVGGGGGGGGVEGSDLWLLDKGECENVMRCLCFTKKNENQPLELHL